jgi:hypothetical protein
MGLNPTILRQARAFALPLSPLRLPALPSRRYRASGLVLGRRASLKESSWEGPECALKQAFHLRRRFTMRRWPFPWRLTALDPVVADESAPSTSQTAITSSPRWPCPPKGAKAARVDKEAVLRVGYLFSRTPSPIQMSFRSSSLATTVAAYAVLEVVEAQICYPSVMAAQTACLRPSAPWRASRPRRNYWFGSGSIRLA